MKYFKVYEIDFSNRNSLLSMAVWHNYFLISELKRISYDRKEHFDYS